MEIQQIIKARRKELDLTLRQVADALGVSEATVSRYESGDIKNMGIDKVEDLARVLRCTAGYLMGWDDAPSLVLSQAEEDLIVALRAADPVTQRNVRTLLGV